MVMRRIQILGTIFILFQFQAFVASLSSSPQNIGNARQASDGLLEHESTSISNELLPATSIIHFRFSTIRDSIPNNNVQKQKQNHQLVLNRRDGIDLYGRQVVHDANDARTGTMSFLHAESTTEEPLKETFSIWDATMVLRPENNNESNDGDDNDSLLFSIGNSQSCFVAMNRFQVKEDCKRLFEERWAQRNSKLPRQPGFIGFSLLRKRGTTEASSSSCDQSRNEFYDCFNYSTCTIWDSMNSWERWRNGGGKTSHETSRETTNGGQKRVPVSEWLEGPSSPIFWDGTACPIAELNDAGSNTEVLSG